MVCLASLATLAGCDDRAPDSALYGTWARSPGDADSVYYQFQPDGTLNVLDSDWKPTNIKGKWYAGGPNIYLRFPSEFSKTGALLFCT